MQTDEPSLDKTGSTCREHYSENGFLLTCSGRPGSGMLTDGVGANTDLVLLSDETSSGGGKNWEAGLRS